jgi:hypothetical protein
MKAYFGVIPKSYVRASGDSRRSCCVSLCGVGKPVVQGTGVVLVKSS